MAVRILIGIVLNPFSNQVLFLVKFKINFIYSCLFDVI
jgi:hypothetical protein